MWNGLLCSICQIRIPYATADCELIAVRPGKLRGRKVQVMALEICEYCSAGAVIEHKKLTIQIAHITRATRHTDPVTKV